MKFAAAFVLLSSVLGAFAVPASQVLTDISTITSQTTSLDTLIKALTSTNVVGALAVHTGAVNLVTAINTATSDSNAVSPNPVSEADGQTILTAVQNLEPKIITTLSDLVAKKATIASINIGGLTALVLQDLQNLSAATISFENSLVAAAPADIAAEAVPIITAINSSFSSAIAAFQS